MKKVLILVTVLDLVLGTAGVVQAQVYLQPPIASQVSQILTEVQQGVATVSMGRVADRAAVVRLLAELGALRVRALSGPTMTELVSLWDEFGRAVNDVNVIRARLAEQNVLLSNLVLKLRTAKDMILVQLGQ